MSNNKGENMGKEPRENVYVCEFNCHTHTVDVDDGVTPFMIQCEFRGRQGRPLNPAFAKDGRCIGTAQSTMYPRGPKPPHLKEPTHEWYKPESTKGLSPGEVEHVENGGLLLRPRTGKPPLYHGDP